MSSTRDLSHLAHSRMLGFTVISTVIGLVIVALIAVPLLSSSASGTSSNREVVTTSQDFYYPWENPSATAATQDGDSWTGRGQQYIPLTGLTPGQPLELTVETEERTITDVFLAPTGPVSSNSEPISFERYELPYYLIPSAAETTVWLRARTTDEWTIRIAPADLTERDGVVSGAGAGVFLYTGDATAARITARGETGVRVSVITEAGVGRDSDSFKNSGGTIAWPDTSTAVFVVDDYRDNSSWSIEFLVPAGGADE